MNNTTRLQLIDGPQKGFLEIKEGVSVPLNFSVSDIRDISSRSGMFSKTIALAGTKNNNNLLNNYFDVNIVAGTYDVNKRQKVAIVQNGVILRDNCYMRLLKVKKKQSVDTNVDEWVEYEVQVTDELGDFFKEVGNKELKELDGWEQFKHIYGVDAVVDSFDHTVDDGYKYTLPWISNNQFVMNDLMPGVYAKQIFDRIHSMNGFSYDWATIADDDTQFDKSILPYAGDKKKLTEEYVESVKVIADSPSVQETDKYILGNGVNIGYISSTPILTSNEIKDNSNFFNPTTSIYSNSLTFDAPNTLNYIVKISYDVVFVNDYSYGISLGQAFQRFTSNLRIVDTNGNTLKHTNRLPLEVNPANSSISQYGTSGSELRISHLMGQSWSPGETVVASGNQTFDIPITNLDGTEELRVEVNANMNNSAGSQWRRTGTFDPVDMRMKIVIKYIEIEIAPDSQNGLMPGTEIDIKNFLPNKMKQSDFLKTVYQKYNLYVEVDPDNPSKLIYTSRDKFYDEGEVKDWTEKLDKKREQELYFIPDITTKKMILSYKDDDKDALLDAYRGETSKTFGQVDVTFDNENIKGEERKEEVFSPTINMKTDFDAVLPVLNADFKMNPRILQDGGKLPCQEYLLRESNSKIVSTTFYPHLSMFNKPYNPTFSAEYAQSSYYAYNPGLFTENNLYTLHWRRTLAQINSGKMLKAWFWLTEEDIQGLKMNDKIKVDNAYYYINSVIDYDANSNSVTKVELLTVEDDLKLPRVRGGIKDIGVIRDIVSGTLRPSTPSIPGGFFNGAISRVIKERYDENVVVSSPTPLTGNLGLGNVLPNGFRGVIIGDNQQPSQDGIYVGEGTQITEGGIKSNSLEVPGLTVSEDGFIEFTGTVDLPALNDKEDKSNKVQDLSSPNSTTYPSTNAVKNALDSKVESVTGTGVDNTDPINPIISIDKNTIGLGNVDNTSDANKPISTATQNALNGKEDTSNKVQNLNSPSSTTYPSTQAVYDAMQAIGGGGIVDITYANLKTLKDNNNLSKGTRYYITNREIWIDALDSDKLAMECKRHFRIVKDEYYTPHVVHILFGTENYLGIYGQTIAKGSVPNSGLGGTTYYAIWGGRLWRRNNSGADIPGTSDQTIAGGWALQATTNNTFYESKIFDIKYNFDDDIIWEQADDRGNIVTVTNTGASYIDFLDWGCESIYNNKCYGFRNNFSGSSPAYIYNNTVNGYIANNSNGGSIRNNTNIGNIYRNTNSGDIRENSNLGNINNNSHSGRIEANSNSGSILNNSNRGVISFNSNKGDINNNSGLGDTTQYTKNADIVNNSNNGGITNNNNRGTISKNSNNGVINNNSSVYTTSSTTFLDIMSNSNNGYIQLNRSTGTNVEIKNNSNNGNIGTTSTTNRGSNVQDPIVNK